MSRHVTALYDTRAEAEAAGERLKSGVDVESRVKIIDKSSNDTSEFHSVTMSDEDRHVFGEGLNRGCFMLCTEVDDDERADKIVSLLKQTSRVDLNERQDTWRKDGWQPYGGDKARGALDGRDDPNRGPIDRAQNAIDGRDDPNRGPLDRTANALDGHDDPNRGPIDRASNAIDRNT